MSTIAQTQLFSWHEIDASPEILRLARVLDTLPDAPIIDALIAQRRGKRNDYPIQAVWNSLIAGIVFGHESVESLRRELLRNGELREVCGFDSLRRDDAVPGAPVYSRMLAKLYDLRELIDAMFDELVEEVAALLPDFGEELAIDGKAVQTHGQNDPDARWGAKKTYLSAGANGRDDKHTKWWFGYKLHLIVDANHELPVGFEVTEANVAESTRLMPMVEALGQKHPELLARTRAMSGDRGYDDGQDKAELYDRHGIVPLIDTRNLHTEKSEEGKGLKWLALDPEQHDTIYYDGTGRVACKVAPFEPDAEKAYAEMEFKGFEKDRQTLKFRCPAAAYGIECHNREACRCKRATRDGEHGRTVRIPLERDRRIFMPAHRHSKTFRDAYKKRSSVERVNSRIDQVYGFERHFIRGLAKMRLRLSLTMAVMLATAVAWIHAGEKEKVRSLTRAA